MLTASPSSGQLMVQWVLRSRESLDRIRGVWRRLSADQRGAVAVMSAGLQRKRSSQIHCETDYPVSDPQSIEITYPEPLISVFVASGSFVQSNFEMAGALYSEAATRLQQLAPRRVLDLYCGSVHSLCLQLEPAPRCSASTSRLPPLIVPVMQQPGRDSAVHNSATVRRAAFSELTSRTISTS